MPVRKKPFEEIDSESVDELLMTLRQKDILGIDVLLTALATYRYIERGRCQYLSQVAEKLEIDRETLTRRLDAFERAFEICPFKRSGGKSPTTLVKSAKAEKLFRDLEALHNRLRHVSKHPQKHVITIGASIGLLPHVVPHAIRSFRQQYPEYGDKVEVELYHALPQDLRRRGLVDGTYDIVLTSYDERQDEYGTLKSRFSPFSLKLYLLVPRGHRLSQAARFCWDDLAGMTVYVQDLERDPRPEYPIGRIPLGARVVQLTSYIQEHAIITGGGDICGFGFPQILTHEQRAFIDAVVPDEPFPPLTGAMIRPKQAIEQNSDEHNDIVDTVWNVLEKHLEKLERYGLDTSFRGFKAFTGVFHQTLIDKQLRWMAGHLRSLIVEDDGMIKAEHVVYATDQAADAFVYDINGKLSRSKSMASCQIVWEGLEVSARSPYMEDDDEYALNIIEPMSLLQGKGDRNLTGTWLGRNRWANDYAPSSGYYVLTTNPQEMNVERLTNLVHKHEEHYRKPTSAKVKNKLIIGMNQLCEIRLSEQR